MAAIIKATGKSKVGGAGKDEDTAKYACFAGYSINE